MKKDKLTCPSSVCQEGAELIGIVNQEGMVDILEHPIPVTQEFVEIAHQGRPPEQRFRFANTCVEKGCRQWNGKGCSIGDMVASLIQAEENALELPACGIRRQCRWYVQNGPKACMACPLVTTDAAALNSEITAGASSLTS